jgi:hypothetical protein
MYYNTTDKHFYGWNGTAWVIPNQTTTNPNGLELIKTQTVGSGVNTATITNCFSSAFTNYKVIYTGGTLSANDIGARFGPTSVSGYNTQYYSTLFYANGNVGSFALAQTNNQDHMAWVGGGSTTAAYASFDVMNPYEPTWSRFHGGAYQNNLAIGIQTGEHRSTGQFTDLTLLGGGGATMTGGTIRVYGYRNS